MLMCGTSHESGQRTVRNTSDRLEEELVSCTHLQLFSSPQNVIPVSPHLWGSHRGSKLRHIAVFITNPNPKVRKSGAVAKATAQETQNARRLNVQS